MVLSVLSGHIFTYWELDSACLRRRQFWKVKEIPWNEVTCVSSLGFSSNCVKIDFVPSMAAPNGNSVFVNDTECSEFIAAARRFAPHTAID